MGIADWYPRVDQGKGEARRYAISLPYGQSKKRYFLFSLCQTLLLIMSLGIPLLMRACCREGCVCLSTESDRLNMGKSPRPIRKWRSEALERSFFKSFFQVLKSSLDRHFHRCQKGPLFTYMQTFFSCIRIGLEVLYDSIGGGPLILRCMVSRIPMNIFVSQGAKPGIPYPKYIIDLVSGILRYS